MSARSWWRLVVGLGVWSTLTTSVIAQEAILSWEFPRSYTPAPESFLVTYLSSQDPTEFQQFRVSNGGRASCDGVPEAPTLSPDAVCARTPTCLTPGFYRFWVQAEVEGEASEASEGSTCEALSGCHYDCRSVTMPPALAAAMAEGPGAVQQAVQALAETPTPPATPSVTTATPTVADVVDTVQTALDTLPKAPV
jgi:hypothetical protein